MELNEAIKILKENEYLVENTPVQAKPDDPYYKFYEEIEDCFYHFNRNEPYDLDSIKRRVKRRFGSFTMKMKQIDNEPDNKNKRYRSYYVAFLVQKGECKGAVVFGQTVYDGDKLNNWDWCRAWTTTGNIDLNTFRSTENNPGWHYLEWRRGWDWST